MPDDTLIAVTERELRAARIQLEHAQRFYQQGPNYYGGAAHYWQGAIDALCGVLEHLKREAVTSEGESDALLR